MRFLSNRRKKVRTTRGKNRGDRVRNTRLEKLENRRVLAAVVVSNAFDVVNGDTTSIQSLVASDGGDGISLREAIAATNNSAAADTITFDGALAGATITLSGTSLETDNPLTIDGASLASRVTIDANQQSRVIRSLDDLTINSIVLTGGNAGRGGGIEAIGTLTVNDSLIDANVATQGGGIYSWAEMLEVNNSTVSNNVADSQGGGIYASGPAIISNSSVEANQKNADTMQSGGGGIYFLRTVELISSSVNNNVAHSGEGGGIYADQIHIDEGKPNLLVVDSQIIGNSVFKGEGVRGDGGGVAIRGAMTIRGSLVDNNFAEGSGGGILVDNNTVPDFLTITDSTISNNRSNVGGGVEYGGSGSLQITNSTISGNESQSSVFGGGGVFVNQFFDDARILNSTIANNVSAAGAAGLELLTLGFPGDSTLTINNSILADNVSDSPSFNDLRHNGSTSDIDMRNSMLGDPAGTGISQGFGTSNLIGIDPMLAALQDNGSGLPTHALNPASPAINAGNASLLPQDTDDRDGDGNTSESIPFDQRGTGFDRVAYSQLDIGAFEANASTYAQPVVDLNGLGTGINADTQFLQFGNSVRIAGTTSTVRDLDDTRIPSMTVTVSGDADNDSESLLFGTEQFVLTEDKTANVARGNSTFLVQYSQVNRTFQVTSATATNPTTGAWQLLLRAIKYDNSLLYPTAGPRIVTITANDGNSDSEPAESTVNVVTGTLTAVRSGLTNSEVTVLDVAGDRDNDLHAKIVGNSLVVTSQNEQFQVAPSNSTLSADKSTLTFTLGNDLHELELLTLEGSDTATVDYSDFDGLQGFAPVPFTHIRGARTASDLGGDDNVTLIGNSDFHGRMTIDQPGKNGTLSINSLSGSFGLIPFEFSNVGSFTTQGFGRLDIVGPLEVGSNDVIFDTFLTLEGSTSLSGGSITADLGAELSRSGSLVGNGTVITNDGEFINQGLVNGTGAGIDFASPVSGSGRYRGLSTFFAGTRFGNSPAAIDMETAIFESTNVHEVELGGLTAGTQYDQVNATGTLTLGGTLEIQWIDGFVPSMGDTFEIMTAPTLVGQFENVVMQNLPNDLQIAVNYNTNAVSLEVIEPFIAIVNSNGDFGDSDLADGICNDGTGSCTLRAAIQQTNAIANAGFADVIKFDLPAGSTMIKPLSPLPEVSDAVILDGTSQPLYAGSPQVDLQGDLAGANADGIRLAASGSVIKGLAVSGFSSEGIKLTGVNDALIQDNYIGVDSSGAMHGNRFGLRFVDSDSNTIDGNTISGNHSSGVLVSAASNENVFAANLIGLDPTGQFAVANQGAGILLQGPENVIGKPGAGNTISGNTSVGVSVAAGASATIIQNNKIGTNAAGDSAVANNSYGLLVRSPNNLIGGNRTLGEGNLISGNARHGVIVSQATATGNQILGNLVGTSDDGAASVANGSYGVYVLGADNTTIGSVDAGYANVISGNARSGLAIANGNGSSVSGNQIGTDLSGDSALANGAIGVFLFNGAQNNSVVDNQIAGNSRTALAIIGENSRSNTISSNQIGTDSTGLSVLPNGAFAILVSSPNNTIGGSGGANIIAGSSKGIVLSGANATGNIISGNSIGTGKDGATDLGMDAGLQIANGASGNTIGPDNVIAFNERGIRFLGNSGSENRITQNSFVSNDLAGIDFGNLGLTLNDVDDIDEGANRMMNYPEILSITEVGDDLEVEFSVDTTTSSASLPLTIEFYGTNVASQGEAYIGSATYGAVDLANGSTITSLAGAALKTAGFGFIVATTTDALGNTSEFSIASASGNSESGSALLTSNSMDVSQDGVISAVDALMVINHLNQAEGEAPRHLRADVNGDGIVSAIDALKIINWLSKQSNTNSLNKELSHQQQVDFVLADLDLDNDERDFDSLDAPFLMGGNQSLLLS